MEKCPYCGSPHFRELTPEKGDSYALIPVSKKTGKIHLSEGDPLKAIKADYCESCGKIVLKVVD